MVLKKLCLSAVVVLFLVHLSLWSVAAEETSAILPKSDEVFPKNEVIVLLKKEATLAAFSNDGAVATLAKLYGKPEISQLFPKAGASQDSADVLFESWLFKYRIRQRISYYHGAQPRSVPLHRLYIMKFAGDKNNTANMITALSKSSLVEEVSANYVKKILSDERTAKLLWLKPYAQFLLFNNSGYTPSMVTNIAAVLSYVNTAKLTPYVTDLINGIQNPTTVSSSDEISSIQNSSYIFFPEGTPVWINSCNPDTHHAEQCVPGELLVRFKDAATDNDKAAVFSRLPIASYEHLDLTIYLARLQPSRDVFQNLAQLANESAVAHAEPNYYRYFTSTTPDDPLFINSDNTSAPWHMENDGVATMYDACKADADIDATDGWDYSTGSDRITVGVIDSGFQNTVDFGSGSYSTNDLFEDMSAGCVCGSFPDYAAYVTGLYEHSNIWRNEIEMNYWANTADQNTDADNNGYVADTVGWNFSDNTALISVGDHGTEVASIIASYGNNAHLTTGVAWRARLMNLDVGIINSVGDEQNLSIDNIVKAIKYASDAGAAVINMSFGNYSVSDSEKYDIDNHGGMLFVAAAGNDQKDNDKTPFYPASLDSPNIISVAASACNDDFASSFSNFGQGSVDVSAPGQYVFALKPYGSAQQISTYVSGTSFAAPIVSGMAVDVWAYYPNMAVNELKDCLMNGVDKISAMTGKVSSGGRVNLNATMQCVATTKTADEKREADLAAMEEEAYSASEMSKEHGGWGCALNFREGSSNNPFFGALFVGLLMLPKILFAWKCRQNHIHQK